MPRDHRGTTKRIKTISTTINAKNSAIEGQRSMPISELELGKFTICFYIGHDVFVWKHVSFIVLKGGGFCPGSRIRLAGLEVQAMAFAKERAVPDFLFYSAGGIQISSNPVRGCCCRHS